MYTDSRGKAGVGGGDGGGVGGYGYGGRGGDLRGSLDSVGIIR